MQSEKTAAPLRADDARIACPLFQAEYGGEVPTSALQLHVGKMSRSLFQTLNRAWHSRLPECGNCFMGDCFGAEFGNKYYAVAWWSHPVARALEGQGLLELRRMAVVDDAPKNTASRFLSVMTLIIRKTKPDIQKLISYQDTDVHTGTIYKAAGWEIGNIGERIDESKKYNNWKTRPNRVNQSTAPKIRWEKAL